MTATGPVLLSLASRQAWPHILAAARIEPAKLVLLHSGDENESRRPAERLKTFFDGTARLVGAGGTALAEIPDNDFQAIQNRLDGLAAEFTPAGAGAMLNFTGGNKLMATAAFRWAERNRVASFYLERGNRLTRFEPSSGGFATKTEKLDAGITDGLDALALLRCQLSASEVEREGQRLTLSPRGRELDEADFLDRLALGWNRPEHSEIEELLDIEGTADREFKEGDTLEFQTAAVALRHGAREVRRSLRLKVDSPRSYNPHQEIDLIFNWGGRLWLVDCKDRASGNSLVRGLRREMEPHITPQAEYLLGRLNDEMRINPVKALKEDLIANLEIGGLRGRVVCVRKVTLQKDVHSYAKSNGIEVVHKEHAFHSFRRLMRPGGAASR